MAVCKLTPFQRTIEACISHTTPWITLPHQTTSKRQILFFFESVNQGVHLFFSYLSTGDTKQVKMRSVDEFSDGWS